MLEEIEMQHIKTDDQVADLFTKSLSTNKFEMFRHQLGIVQRMEVDIEGECKKSMSNIFYFSFFLKSNLGGKSLVRVKQN